jgi:spermidine synthase
MQVRRDDARRFLSADDRRYDVIVGDLFHPDLAGTGSLLSVEQFARARGRLAPGGLFTQWLTLNQFDQRSLDAVLRSFRRVFPQAQLFMDGMHLALVGPNADGPGAAIGAAAIASNLDRLDPQAREAATGGEGPWTWLGRYWGPIADSTGPLQHEWMPFIEFRLPKVRYGDGAQVAALLAELLRRRPDAAAAAGLLGVAPADREPFARAYAATSLAASAWVAAIGGDADQAVQLERRAYESNPRDRWIANSLADALLDSLPQARRAGLGETEALQRILRVSPDHVETLRALWHVERSAGHAVAAEQYRSRLLAVSPFDFEARTRAPDS